jgi:enoyl-CoA hydratase
MAEQTVKAEHSGRVLTVRLHNPPHNFMTGGMIRELDELVRRIEGDSSVRAVVLTGDHPQAFITHYDIVETLEQGLALERALSSPWGAGRVAAGHARLCRGAGAPRRAALARPRGDGRLAGGTAAGLSGDAA